ncbi:MAG TPA: hypothetical protein EYM84_04520 [Flavobacteriales bacterium]|nr:hypothetical protein [Flavobacteriales bacterium]
MKFLLNLILVKVFLLLTAFGDVQGQGLTKNNLASVNTIFLEIGGAAGIPSLNYDRLVLSLDDRIKLSGRVGISSYSDFHKDISPDLFIPFGVFIMYAYGVNHIELGLGLTYLNYSAYDIGLDGKVGFVRKKDLLSNPSIGYRLQKTGGGIFLRLSYTPFIYGKPIIFSNWGGLSIGYTFKKDKSEQKPLINNPSIN